MREYNLPTSLIDYDKHAIFIGMTGSGKSVFAQWFVQNKVKVNSRVLYISAKLEPPEFYDKFSLHTESVKTALKNLVSEDIESISLRIPYMAGDYLLTIFDQIESLAKKAISQQEFYPISVIVDEISLMVRHKMESSPATMALGRAAAIWRGYNLQLIAMSQRTSHIPQTVLTQANSVILFKFKQSDLDSLKKLIGKDVEKHLKWLHDNEFHFIEFESEKEQKFYPINMEELHDYSER